MVHIINGPKRFDVTLLKVVFFPVFISFSFFAESDY